MTFGSTIFLSNTYSGDTAFLGDPFGGSICLLDTAFKLVHYFVFEGMCKVEKSTTGIVINIVQKLNNYVTIV